MSKVDAQSDGSLSEYTLEKAWVLKGRLLPTLFGSSAGLGVEKQIGEKSSIVILFNAINYRVAADSPENKIRSVNPEFRYHFNKFSNESLFVSCFLALGNHSRSLGGEIDPENFTHYKGGNFFGAGFLIGKNIKLGNRFYVDAYVGPRLRFQTEKILERTIMQTTETEEINSKFGVRFGLNLNYVIRQ